MVPIRLSDPERAQIASGAGRMRLTLSGFIRQAALQASAIVEQKASVKASEHEAAAEHERPLVLLDTESEPHIVDGEIVSW